MTARVLTLGHDASVPEAAALLRRERIGAVPIVDGDDRLCGILTRSDLLGALIETAEEAQRVSA
jgi:CBS domain-containing protein